MAQVGVVHALALDWSSMSQYRCQIAWVQGNLIQTLCAAGFLHIDLVTLYLVGAKDLGHWYT